MIQIDRLMLENASMLGGMLKYKKTLIYLPWSFIGVHRPLCWALFFNLIVVYFLSRLVQGIGSAAQPIEKIASLRSCRYYWVAVKELNLSYYIGETLLFTIYTHCGNSI